MSDTWEDCLICGRHVRCGACGNNCCNGGTGTLPDGSECGCESAYEMQDRGEKETPAFRDLSTHQEQADMHGEHVTVSRQAVDEVLEEYRALRAQLKEAQMQALAASGQAQDAYEAQVAARNAAFDAAADEVAVEWAGEDIPTEGVGEYLRQTILALKD